MQENKEVLISVIVPVYNIEDYLKRCVDSITSQSYRSLEILLVDDGSTDGSLKLCGELAAEDARIRVLHKENGGSSSARNMGITHAQGEYIGFVDSDDYIDALMYEKLYEAVCRYGTAAAQCGRDEIDEDGKLLPLVCMPPERETVIEAEEFLKEMLLHKGDASFCTKLVHRRLFERERFPEGELNEDFHLLVKLLPFMEKGITSIPLTGYHVFYRMGSNTRVKGSQNFSRVYRDNVKNADMAETVTAQRYPALVPYAKRFGLFQRMDYMLHVPIKDMKRENSFYREVVRYLRKNLRSIVRGRDLTGKNRIYLLLFALAPGMVRKIHSWIIRARA